MLIRILDFCLALVGLLVGSPIILVVLIIGYFETGSPIFRQERLGRNQKPFVLVKFRTMCPGTACVATHEADPEAITKVGHFLRRTKLDELPQLWNVLKGEMSLVGPRPGLFNQPELTAARQQKKVYKVRPGITGLGQINEIDMSTPELLAKIDAEMIRTMNLKNYLKYILLTATGKGCGDRVPELGKGCEKRVTKN